MSDTNVFDDVVVESVFEESTTTKRKLPLPSDVAIDLVVENAEAGADNTWYDAVLESDEADIYIDGSGDSKEETIDRLKFDLESLIVDLQGEVDDARDELERLTKKLNSAKGICDNWDEVVRTKTTTRDE